MVAPSSVPPRFRSSILSPRRPSSSRPPWTTPQPSRPRAEGRSSRTSSLCSASSPRPDTGAAGAVRSANMARQAPTPKGGLGFPHRSSAPMEGLSLIDISGEARSCQQPRGAHVQRSKSPRTSMQTQTALLHPLLEGNKKGI